MAFDLLSIPMAPAIAAITSVIVIASGWRINKALAGTKQWMIAIASFAIALLLLTVQDALPALLTIFLANLIIAIGVLLITIGSRSVFKRKAYTIQISSALFIPFSLSFYYFTFLTPNESYRILIMSLFWLSSLLISLSAAIFPQSSSNFLAGRVIFSITCFCLIGLIGFRLYTVLNHIPVSSVFSSFVVSLPIDNTVLIALYGFILSYLILCNEHKEQQLVTLKQLISRHQPLNQIIKKTVTNDFVNEHKQSSKSTKNNQKKQANNANTAVTLELDTTTTILSAAVTDIPLQPNLLNSNLLQRQQENLPDHEFTKIITRLPQRLTQLTTTANKAFKANEFKTLKLTLHALATNADQVGLEKLSEMALSLEFSPPGKITAANFTQLVQLCEASINKLQNSGLARVCN